MKVLERIIENKSVIQENLIKDPDDQKCYNIL